MPAPTPAKVKCKLPKSKPRTRAKVLAFPWRAKVMVAAMYNNPLEQLTWEETERLALSHYPRKEATNLLSELEDKDEVMAEYLIKCLHNTMGVSVCSQSGVKSLSTDQ